MWELKSFIIHSRNLNQNFVPVNVIASGFFMCPKHVRDEPAFAVPISTLIDEMSLGVNPIFVANWLEMQHPALFPESTSAEQGMLKTRTGTYMQAFTDIVHT